MIPTELEPIIEETRDHITQIRHDFEASLSAAVPATATTTETTRHEYYQTVTAFIDKIDKTREFATQHGEQCTICVGFAAMQTGRPVAGILYRPLSSSRRRGRSALTTNSNLRYRRRRPPRRVR